MLHTQVSTYMGALIITVVGAVATLMIVDAATMAAEISEYSGIDVFSPSVVLADE